MTPEQRAFFEYGQTFELIRSQARLVRTGRKRCAENPGRYGPGLLMARVLFGRTVNEARQKRAVCRAWINREKRSCGNCRYREINEELGNICWKCTRNGGIYSDNWEPRKEGKNND